MNLKRKILYIYFSLIFILSGSFVFSSETAVFSNNCDDIQYVVSSAGAHTVCPVISRENEKGAARHGRTVENPVLFVEFDAERMLNPEMQESSHEETKDFSSIESNKFKKSIILLQSVL